MFKLLESIWKMVTLQNGITIRSLPLFPPEVYGLFLNKIVCQQQIKHTSIYQRRWECLIDTFFKS